MNILETEIQDVLVLEPKVFKDDRGYFFESYRQSWLPEVQFVQDNQSASSLHTLRGIHYQINLPQGKLVRVTQGAVLDVAVDLRKSSPTFGQHVSRELSADNHLMMWIPEGFGHGFLALTERAEFQYKCTNYYDPTDQHIIRWNDPELNLPWGVETPFVSERDAQGLALAEAKLFD
ncbi:MAG: dTDP-4-dehydrorhamnose 3,5-epimerase [Pseudomonadales bacterium]